LKGGEFYTRKAEQKGRVRAASLPALHSRPAEGFSSIRCLRGFARYKDRDVQPKRTEDVSYADVEEWLTAPSEIRRPLMPRFRSRLSDPAFRSALVANLKSHPEWDPILFPEKYKPKEPRPKGPGNGQTRTAPGNRSHFARSIPMKLIVKFNLVFIVVFLLGLAAAGYVSRELLQANARDEIVQSARLVMESALANRAYTSSQVAPLLQTQMKYSFLPQSVPAYSATEVFATVRKTFPDYAYKEATLNPTNPRNRANDWEADIVNQFRNAADKPEVIGERDTPNGRSFYIARPMQIKNEACLACHSTVDAAPKTLVDRYGPANGFGWKLNEVIGAQIVSVPTDVPIARANRAFQTFMLSLTAVFRVHLRRAEPYAMVHGDPARDAAVAPRRPGEPGREHGCARLRGEERRRDRDSHSVVQPHEEESSCRR
jgi:protein-histidine pros-kinase